MPTCLPRVLRPLAAAALLASAPAAAASAQTITFSPADFAGSGVPLPDGYGATANVATTYRTLGTFGDAAPIAGMAWWDLGYSALQGVGYGNATGAGSVAEVGLQTTGPGLMVTLSDFDIGSWQSSPRMAMVQILDWDFSLLLPAISAPIGATSFSFADYLAANALAAPTSATGIRIQFTQDADLTTAGVQGRGAFDAGIDNVTFDAGAVAAVPEPGTWALLATGLAGLGVVARRRRNG